MHKILLGAAFFGAASLSMAGQVTMQQSMSNMCADELTHFNVASAPDAQKICSCITNVQAENLTLGEYWDMQNEIRAGKNPNTLPQIQRIEPKLKECRVGVSILPPSEATQAMSLRNATKD